MKYGDPIGHDVVFINGGGIDPKDANPTLEDLKLWEDWIRAYKGWSEEKLQSFLKEFQSSKNSNSFLSDYGLHIFKAQDTSMNGIVAELDSYVAKIKDATLVGFSYGANIVMNYMAAQNDGTATSKVTKFVLINAPNPTALDSLVGHAIWKIDVTWPESILKQPSTCGDTNCPVIEMNGGEGGVVNLYNPDDQFAGRLHNVSGVYNIEHHSSNDPYWHHLRPGYLEASKTFTALDVNGDHGAYSAWSH